MDPASHLPTPLLLPAPFGLYTVFMASAYISRKLVFFIHFPRYDCSLLNDFMIELFVLMLFIHSYNRFFVICILGLDRICHRGVTPDMSSMANVSNMFSCFAIFNINGEILNDIYAV